MKSLAVCVGLILSSSNFLIAGTWTTLNFPGSVTPTYTTSTFLTDIDGTNIVGFNGWWNHEHGFLYDGTNWTTLDMPTAATTRITGISGNKIVGTYREATDASPGMSHGFLYDGTNWITLDNPNVEETAITGICGNIVVGSTKGHAYFYDGTQWITIAHPNASKTDIYGIAGENILGSYDGHGFIYNMLTQIWTTIDAPGATNTRIHDMDGDNIIGQFSTNDNTTSFLYDGTTWLPFDGTGFDSPGGISGNTIVGSYGKTYYGDNGVMALFFHGFTYTIPEPATLLLLGFGGLLLKRRK
jgi:hypothetical protein